MEWSSGKRSEVKMGCGGRLVSQVSLKWKGDVFHLFLYPNLISAPQLVTSVDLLSGTWGTVGSLVIWNFNHEGRKCSAKEIIEAVDREKKSITYKVMEGDVMEAYSEFKISVDVKTMKNGEDNIVTWTLDYDKKTESIPDPHSLLDVGVAITKSIQSQPIPTY